MADIKSISTGTPDGMEAFERARAARERRPRETDPALDAAAAIIQAASRSYPPPPPPPPPPAANSRRGMFAYVARVPPPPPPPPPVDYGTLLQLAAQDDRPGATLLLQGLLSLINSVGAASGTCSDGKHWSCHAKEAIEKRLLDADGKNIELILPAFAPGLISKVIIEELNEARGANRDAFGHLTLKDLILAGNSDLQLNAIKKGMSQELIIAAAGASASSGGIRVGAYSANRLTLTSAMAYKIGLRAKLASSCGKCDYRMS